jgi:hypothetical protein
MKEEKWLPIRGFEDLYEISEFGQVRSLPRMTVHGIRGGKVLRWRKCGLEGRPCVRLSKAGLPKRNSMIHLLVLDAFVGPRPQGLIGCHNDGDFMNNHDSNLRWDTYKNNSADIKKHGTANYIPRRKLTSSQIQQIVARRAAGEECLPIAKDFGIVRSWVGVLYRRSHLCR